MMITYFPRGSITEFTNNEEFCASWVITPGVSVLPRWFLIIFYMLWLFYLFLGINVISDVFMGAIEVITSQTKVIMVRDPDYEGEFREQKVAVWNPTFANLTLMALGSSAPEIILNTFETCTTLGSTPGELGAATIVGSASFNFLVISGVSIYAVSEAGENRTQKQMDEDKTPKGVKKVDDLGVFSITTTWSVIAYIWLFYVLIDYEVEAWEAYLTFGFFWILIIMAVSADMYRRNIIKRKEEERIGNLDEMTQDEKENMKKGKKVTPADACISKGYAAHDFYNTLLPLEKGERIEDPEVQQK